MIDIIIPAYNAHKYLPKCLSSIAIQTIKDKIKVYVIDDHSNKDYKEIVDIFKGDLDITLYRNRKNIGPGLSRQKGLEISNGKFVMFLDSDDSLYNPFSMKELYELTKEDKFDIMYGKYYEVYEDGCIIPEVVDGNLHAKLYRRKFIEDNDIKFPSTKYHEDNIFNHKVILGNARPGFTNAIIMLYIRRDDSLSDMDNYSYDTIETYISVITEFIHWMEEKKYNKENIGSLVSLAISYLYVNYYYNIRDKNSHKIIDLSEEIYRKFIEYRKYYNYNRIYNYILAIDNKNSLNNDFSEFIKLYEEKYKNV